MATTLLSLRTQAKQRANMEQSNFVSDSEWNSYINNAASALYDLLVQAYEDYYLVLPAPEFTVTAGNSRQALPADFYKLRGLDYKLGTSDYVQVDQFQFGERNSAKMIDVRRIYDEAPVNYRIMGSYIQFLPEDRAPGTYKLWYIPRFVPMASDNDTFDGVNGWEEFIVVAAAIKALSKEESDTTDLVKEYQEIKDRIEGLAAERDAGVSERITDVYKFRRAYWYDDAY